MAVGVFDDDSVRAFLLHAWLESQPGTTAAHEEGGFVLRNSDGSLTVERWPGGAQNEIFVPPHPGGKRGDLLIVATFHTHPNPGADYQQEPSLTDIRAVRGDPHLSNPDYEGEYVIAPESIYRIRKNGDVDVVGKTDDLLKIV
jgi:hypothetical protein